MRSTYSSSLQICFRCFFVHLLLLNLLPLICTFVTSAMWNLQLWDVFGSSSLCIFDTGVVPVGLRMLQKVSETSTKKQNDRMSWVEKFFTIVVERKLHECNMKRKAEW